MRHVMIVIALLVSLSGLAAQNAPAPCVILKRATSADHIITGIEFYYVSGTFPRDYKFRTNLRGRHVRELVKKGGAFSIVESKYTQADLEQAEKSCSVDTAKIAEK
jgi:hypothetical protein